MKNKQSKLTILSTAIALSLTLGSVAFAAANNNGGPGGPGGPQSNPEVFEMGTPPDFEAGSPGEGKENVPEPPKDENGNPMAPPENDSNGKQNKDTNTNKSNQNNGKPGDAKGDPHQQLIEKINAMEDSDTKTDLLNKAEAAEKAMKEFMDAAQAAGLVEAPPEKPSNDTTTTTSSNDGV